MKNIVFPFQVKKQKSKKENAKTAPSTASSAAVKGELTPPPDFLSERLALWDRLKKEQDEKIAAKTPEPIVITLPDGKQVDGQSWRTTPYDVACGISKGLADNTVISKESNLQTQINLAMLEKRNCDKSF